MKTSIRAVTAIVLMGLGSVLARPALASCGSTDLSVPGPALDSGSLLRFGNPGDEKAADETGPGLRQDPDAHGWPWKVSIVGLWKFAFIAKGNARIPDGHVIDAGYVTWHSDGTELMNSGRPAITGSFCMGVWKQTAAATFKLNHIGLSWDSTGASFVGEAHIRETVKVARDGDHYTGTFVIEQFSTDGITILDRVTGVVSATRVKVD